MKTTTRLLLLNATLLLASSLAISFIFCLMWYKNAVYVFEDILFIRAVETGMAIIFLLIGIASFAYCVKKQDDLF